MGRAQKTHPPSFHRVYRGLLKFSGARVLVFLRLVRKLPFLLLFKDEQILDVFVALLTLPDPRRVELRNILVVNLHKFLLAFIVDVHHFFVVAIFVVCFPPKEDRDRERSR
eukprot:GEMP01082124.1.p1 GENE.GEMP01082124.1~~GEMP01082124.1.p1  ORF type:complete len:111 (-),score=0.87 GEMP01082124.1:41-373(-)